MRLPLSKVYRAFPELDRFDDGRCEAYVRTVRRSQGVRGAFIGWWHRVLGVVTALVLMSAFGWSAAQLFGTSMSNGGILGVLAFLIAIAVLPPLLGGLLALQLRDVRLRKLLRRQISSSKCPECGYLLLGLVPRDDCVRCPECGTSFALAELGLTAADISMDRGLDEA